MNKQNKAEHNITKQKNTTTIVPGYILLHKQLTTIIISNYILLYNC